MFFPNKCGVCDEIKDLKKCTRCNLISYCGGEHQRQHLKDHKKICKILDEMLKEYKLSHIFEKSHGADHEKWLLDRELIMRKMNQKLGRNLDEEEKTMFRMPRNCLVCHETRNSELTNCPQCPFASFCKDHRENNQHEKYCSLMQNFFRVEIYNSLSGPERYNESIISILHTEFKQNLKPPSNMDDFFDFYVDDESINVDVTLKMIASDYFSVPLTLFNALKKLNYCHTYSLTLHVGGTDFPFEHVQVWETILHLLPNLKKLLVVYVGQKFNFHRIIFPLCGVCSMTERTIAVDVFSMNYKQYVNSEYYEKPDLVAFLNLVSPADNSAYRGQYEEDFVLICGRIRCCLVVTTTSEKKMYSAARDFQSALCFREILEDDINQFASLKPQIQWEDGTAFRANQNMLIFSLPTRKFFYGTNCHVCHSNETFVTCEFCRMIFYCDDEHQQDDYFSHKDLCKVLIAMMDKTETMCFYSHLKGVDSETWVRAKIEILVKVELKLGRRLMDFEEELLLFPKACFVCHESDLDVLNDCECGISLCQDHRDDDTHDNLCKEFDLAYRVSTAKQFPIISTIVKDVIIEENENLPPSLDDFINKFLQIGNKISDYRVPNYDRLMIGEFLTRPLTLLYAIKRLHLHIKPTMVIHVLGASTFEIWSQKYWKILLFWLQNLKNLIVVFIGPEIQEFTNDSVELIFSETSLGDDQRLCVISPPVHYEDYYKHKSFLKPDIVIGFNLEIHEIELGISSSTWKQMLLTVEQLNVPFILTAGSKERARNDHRIMSILMDMRLTYFSLESNPFAGRIPERDFQTERLRYSNKYVTIYSRLRENLVRGNIRE